MNSFFIYWVVVKWEEDGELLKEVVPLNWVDERKKIFRYPKHGLLSELVEKSVHPKEDWFTLGYQYIEMHTSELDIARQVLALSSTTSNNLSDDDDDSELEKKVDSKDRKKRERERVIFFTFLI